jgi:tetratricopeptide (TPR) repeat protein
MVERIMPYLDHVLLATFTCVCVFTAACRKPEQKAADFLNHGKVLAQKGDYGRALLELQNAAKLRPSDAETMYQLGMTYLRMQNIRPAVMYLRKAVELNPKHLAAKAALAELLAEADAKEILEQAAMRASEVVKTDAGNADAWNALAVAELKLGRVEDAEKHIYEALRRFPEDLKASATLASIKLNNKDFAGAETVMKEAVRLAPKSLDCALALAQFYVLTGKLPQAETELYRAVSLDSQSGRALFDLATVQDRLRQFDEAEHTLKRLSTSADSRYNIVFGDYLFRRGKKQEAIAEYRRLTSVSPDDRQARTRLVAAYTAAGRRAEAEKIVSSALKNNPKDFDALVQRAGFDLDSGKLESAEVDLNSALQERHDSAQVHFFLAQVHRFRNERTSESQELEQALQLDPTLLAARLQLAHALTISNAAQSAREVLSQAPSDQKTITAFHIERNTALFAEKDFSELRRRLDEDLAGSQDPTLLFQDGLLRLYRHDLAGGRKSLKEVLKLQPQNWRALQALADSYLAQGKNADGTAVVRQYTAPFAQSAEAQNLLGRWLLRTQDFAGARLALESAKRVAAPAEATTIELALAEVDVAEHNLDSARNRMTTVLGKDASNVPAIFSLAQIEDQAGRKSEAIKYYDRVLQADPSNVIVLNNLAYLLVDTGTDVDRGLQLAQKAQELAPDDPTVNDTIGWAYYCKGLHKNALEYLSKAAENGTPRRKSHLALAYIKTGERQKALILLDSVRKEDPSLPEIQTALSMLRQSTY